LENIRSYLVITIFSLLLIIGCSSNGNESKNNSQTNAYHKVREIAWEYMILNRLIPILILAGLVVLGFLMVKLVKVLKK
jgi:hypothetical protein